MTDGPLSGDFWSIEPREVERHEARRGKRHAFATVDPTRMCLVVIDMVPFFAGEARLDAIVAEINELVRATRDAGGSVAWVVPATVEPSTLDIEFYGAEVASRYGTSGGNGGFAERLCPDLAFEESDQFVEKSSPSALFPGRSDLHERLLAMGVDTIVVAGTVANVCVESTVRDGFTLGYRCIVAADAVAASTVAILNASLRTIYRSFGDVRTTRDIVGLLMAGSNSVD